MRPPAVLDSVRSDTERIGFTLSSDQATGELLRVLAASRRAGRLLELGTGTGMGTAWILDGMDPGARLISVDTDPDAQDVARRHLDGDPRVTFHLGDGAAFLEDSNGSFDLIYADAWPGKFSHLDLALSRLRPGGLYVIDDLLPQANWPDGHAPKVQALIADLQARPDVVTVRLAWSTGLMIVARLR